MSAKGINRRQFLFVAASVVASGLLLKQPRLGSAVDRPRETTAIRRAYGGNAYGRAGYGTASVYSPRL